MQYRAEWYYAPALGMNPEGIILRGSSALGNRPLGFLAVGSQGYSAFIYEIQAVGESPEAQSKVVDSFMPTDY